MKGGKTEQSNSLSKADYSNLFLFFEQSGQSLSCGIERTHPSTPVTSGEQRTGCRCSARARCSSGTPPAAL